LQAVRNYYEQLVATMTEDERREYMRYAQAGKQPDTGAVCLLTILRSLDDDAWFWAWHAWHAWHAFLSWSR
jgi:hypothetical protein